MYRLVVVVAVALVLSVSGALGLAQSNDPSSEPAPAAGDAAGLVAAGSGDVAAFISSTQARLRQLPEDDASWADLGLAYVEQARITGNPSYYAQAEQSVERSLEVRPDDNAAALAASAALSAARHDFSDSLAAADEALRIDPYQPGALAVRVDALTELGRYDDQLRALRTADTRQPGTPVAARYAYAAELRGDLRRASEVLSRAADVAGPADRAYLLTLLSDLDRRRGLLDRSADHVGEALRLGPDYVPARVANARLAVARGDLDVAVRRWSGVVEALPLPEYLVELGELFEHLGREDEAQAQYDVVGSTTRLFEASGVDTDLEVALFEADHGDPQAAKASARSEWQRRTSVHVADVYAWSLHRAGDDGLALRLARQATRLGTAEARFWLHRGTIEAALGLDSAARAHLRRGLATDAGVSPLQADAARALLRTIRGAR